mmetsp:Transcript_72388/g.125500  ORF Transcript_72388/g.125500 Transcript_72388/m.125500 type:complete len:230 (-) Transcript_72388:53-742(-)
MVDYSKFDHIEDSDEEKEPQKLEPPVKPVEERKPEDDKGQADAEADAKKDEKQEEKPAHQHDRFSYSDKDVSKELRESLQEALKPTPERPPVTIAVAGGSLTLEGSSKVEGEALRTLIRGKLKYILEFTFTVSFAFRWMGTNFDEGLNKAEGTIKISEFTVDALTEGLDSKPVLKAQWKDLGSPLKIDQDKKKAVQDKLGHREWPPPADSLMAGVYSNLQKWLEALPKD